MSYVLDDEETRNNQGLVKFSRLSHLWDDPARPAETCYPEDLHRIFLRLMERFDLSYRVAGLSKDEEVNPVSLIAQLVPDTTPAEEKYNHAWTPKPASAIFNKPRFAVSLTQGMVNPPAPKGCFIN